MTPDDALAGFYARASQDATLKTLLGTKTGVTGAPARFWPDWPTDTMEAADFPRGTYLMIGGPPPAGMPTPSRFQVRLQVVGWFWPDGTHAAKRAQFATRMVELFEQQIWTYGTARLRALLVGMPRDLPSDSESPAGRSIDLRIDVTPAS